MYAHVHQARLNLGIRRRLSPLLGNDRKRIELLNALLFSLPGTPVLYYGDEIGMGENIFLGDRNGVRTPMQWSSDKNAGFSRGNPQSLYLPIIYDPEYHYEAVNVEAQLGNPHSLLWWMRRLLALRKRYRALGEGRCEFLQPENRKILSYFLRHEQETLLVVANLSRFVQPVELDLSPFKHHVPVELFGRTDFPRIESDRYFLTLGPHSFFWFALESRVPTEVAAAVPGSAGRVLTVGEDWTDLIEERQKSQLENLLPDHLRKQRWFGAKARTIKNLTIRESIRIPSEGPLLGALVFVQVDYVQGDPDVYLLPTCFAEGAAAEELRSAAPGLIIVDVKVQENGASGVLYDGVGNPSFCRALLETIGSRRRVTGQAGEVAGVRTVAFKRILGTDPIPIPAVAKAEQSNSSILFGEKFVLKLYRRIEPGISPEVEIGEFLTDQQFPHAPALAGTLQYSVPGQESRSLAVAHAFVPNARDAWNTTLDALGRFYERIGTLDPRTQPPPFNPPLLAGPVQDLPVNVQELVGTFIESARLLGDRTAALHLSLASDGEKPRFAPEPFTPHYVRGLFQSMRNLAVHNFRLLRRQLKNLPPETLATAEKVAGLEGEIIRRYRPLYERRISAKRTRIHGDFHLGQVLWTGKDFTIIDFEGEPAVALTERRIKRSPLRDVAGMIRSFHYATYSGLYQHLERGSATQENLHAFEAWGQLWYRVVTATYVRAYLQGLGSSDILPKAPEEIQLLLETYLLNKAVYELGYELNNRPDWLMIPMRGILELLERKGPA
jgi:maltose alpha-D-glucosyltransferase/alpha-amylase